MNAFSIMSEISRSSRASALEKIFKSYSSEVSYEYVNLPRDARISLVDFANDRVNKISPVIKDPAWTSRGKARDSFLSEWIVMLGLRKALSQTELFVELAPPNLEIGTFGRSGVDLIVSKSSWQDTKNIPVFAINVKLKQLKVRRRVDRYKYDSVLGCPAMELSLGDFNIYTKKSGEVSIVPWLRKVAAPNIAKSGKLPDFQKWQEYLTKKIAETVSHYMVKTDDFLHGGYKPSHQESNLFPNKIDEFSRFYENLSFTYMLFKKICEDGNIKYL